MIEFRIGPQRTAAQQYSDHRDALGFEFLQQRQIGRPGARLIEITAVALAFGIRLFADDHDGGIRFGFVTAVQAALDTAAPLQGIGDAFVDRGRAGEVGIAVAGALPGQRPAAGLAGDVIGAITGDQHMRVGFQRQQAFVVFQQDQRFPHGTTRQSAVLGGTDRFRRLGGQTLRRTRRIEQAGTHLDTQDAAHGIIDAGHRDLAAFDRSQQIAMEGFPFFRHHEQIDAGQDRRYAIGIRTAGNLADAVPVADHDAVETQTSFQYLVEQILMAVQLLALPAVERNHHRLRTGTERAAVTGTMHGGELGLTDPGIALIDAIGGCAITDEMLGGGDDAVVAEEIGAAGAALQSVDQRGSERFDDIGIFRIAFVGAAPAEITGHRHGRREHPADAGCGDFFGGRYADGLDQGRIIGCAQPKIVRKQRGTENIVVAVHGIGAPEHRYAGAADIHGGIMVGIGKCQPIVRLGLLVGLRERTAAVQDRTERVFADVRWRGAADFGLDHLADFLLERHRGKDAVNAFFERWIGRNGVGDGLPIGAVSGVLRRTVDRCRHQRGQTYGCGQSLVHRVLQPGVTGRRSVRLHG